MRAAIAVALAAATLAACGGTTLDGGRLEEDITEDAQREGLTLDSVDCPSPDVEQGARFDCTVTVKGEGRSLEVEQRANEQVAYDLGPLVEFESGSDAGGDEAAIRFVVDAVNRDPAALCDYATRAYRRALGGDRCPRRSGRLYEGPMRDYEVAVKGDSATARAADRVVRLRRQPDGSWLITDAAG